jgi:hypothetical protein
MSVTQRIPHVDDPLPLNPSGIQTVSDYVSSEGIEDQKSVKSFPFADRFEWKSRSAFNSSENPLMFHMSPFPLTSSIIHYSDTVIHFMSCQLLPPFAEAFTGMAHTAPTIPFKHDLLLICLMMRKQTSRTFRSSQHLSQIILKSAPSIPIFGSRFPFSTHFAFKSDCLIDVEGVSLKCSISGCVHTIA